MRDWPERLATGEAVVVPVQGRSMGPAYESAWLAEVHPVERPPAPGDWVLFRCIRQEKLMDVVA